MKPLLICIGTIIFLVLKDVHNVRAATLKCSNTKPTVDLAHHKADAGNTTEKYNTNISNKHKEGNKNSLKTIFHSIQCTLEKAKPWVAELQQEAKRLEEAAKLLGSGILNSFGEFVDKLVEDTAGTTASTQNSTLDSEISVANSTETTIWEISKYLCPEGFVADHNGICERIDE